MSAWLSPKEKKTQVTIYERKGKNDLGFCVPQL